MPCRTRTVDAGCSARSPSRRPWRFREPVRKWPCSWGHLAANVDLPGHGRGDQGSAVFLKAGDPVANSEFKTFNPRHLMTEKSDNCPLFCLRRDNYWKLAESFLVDIL